MWATQVWESHPTVGYFGLVFQGQYGQEVTLSEGPTDVLGCPCLPSSFTRQETPLMLHKLPRRPSSLWGPSSWPGGGWGIWLLGVSPLCSSKMLSAFPGLSEPGAAFGVLRLEKVFRTSGLLHGQQWGRWVLPEMVLHSRVLDGTLS